MEIENLKKIVSGENQQQYNEVTNLLSKIMDFPKDDQPSVAYIDNIDNLKKQNPTFYKDIAIGQYIIIFPKSSKVVIYDKDNNKIINFSSYKIQVQAIDESKIPESEFPFTVEIKYQINITENTRNRVKKLLEESSSHYKITESSTNSNSYVGYTIVLNNKENKPNMSQNIVSHTGISKILETIPQGENSSTADAVIIIGNE